MKFQNTALTVLAALGLGLVSTQASAFSTLLTNTSFSAQAGASTVDFGVSPINNSLPVAGNAAAGDVVYSGSAGGVGYTYTDGALYNISVSPITNITARPANGSAGNFWSVGATPAEQTGPGVVTFTHGLQYYGFLWGSADAYNKVSFYQGTTLLGSYTGAPGTGNQGVSSYFNAYAGAGEQITSIKFESSASNAFETDNHAFLISPIPEPETYAMLLAGLGLMGTIVRRRNKSKAA